MTSADDAQEYGFAHLIGAEIFQQDLNLLFDQIPDRANLLGGQVLGIGDVPVFPAFGPDQGAGVAAAHGHGNVVLDSRYLVQRFGNMFAQLVTTLAHELDGARIDAPGRGGAAAVGFHLARSVQPREGFRHLAAVAILNADIETALGHTLPGY